MPKRLGSSESGRGKIAIADCSRWAPARHELFRAVQGAQVGTEDPGAEQNSELSDRLFDVHFPAPLELARPCCGGDGVDPGTGSERADSGPKSWYAAPAKGLQRV